MGVNEHDAFLDAEGGENQILPDCTNAMVLKPRALLR